MRQFKKLLLIFFLATLASVVPFLILGESFEAEIQAWFQAEWTPIQRFLLIVTLLAVDIAIPIPSSAVSTYGGAILGVWLATLASWIGMMLGSLSGFCLSRFAGAWVIKKYVNPEDYRLMQTLNKRYSIWTIILTRPLPILSEATILLLGSFKLPWSKLLLPLAVSNLFIAFAYSAIGAWSVETDTTLNVVIASTLLPLGLTFLVRFLVSHSQYQSIEKERSKPH